MCGRFHLGLNHHETQKIIKELPEDQLVQLRFGDIFPASFTPVLTAEETIIAKWGFERFDKKGVLINARAETVTQKPTFCKNFLERRCLIPANGFYEWDEKKNKFYFSRKDGNLLYLCGFYRLEDGENRFIILTKASSPPVSFYHNRTPVIADDRMKHKYLTDMYFASDYIDRENTVELKTKN